MPLQATSGAASYDAFGGGVPVAVNYIEDVFSTYLYTGTGASQTVTNGIDLSTKGGLVWVKSRAGSIDDHILVDTARGTSSGLRSNLTNAASGSGGFTSFNTDGFSFDSSFAVRNDPSTTYVSWTFRKQPKFFDIVTYTGDGTSNRAINHNLGSVPGCIILKRYDGAVSWQVYHRATPGTPQDNTLQLNTSDAMATSAGYWGTTAFTDTQFRVSSFGGWNASGGTYVAYVYAHDAGGFGLTGTDNVISCGSFTTDGSSTFPEVTLGYEPQWVLLKRVSNFGSWSILDNMRGLTVNGNEPSLSPNNTNAEAVANFIEPTATGFSTPTNNNPLYSSSTYIYIAIRRGPMKVPTSGTSVFAPVARNATGAVATVTAGFAPDLLIAGERGAAARYATDKLRGRGLSDTSTTGAEQTTATDVVTAYTNTGITLGADSFGYGINSGTAPTIDWFFQRAPSFFDEVCYTGDGTSNRAINHNLGVVPELIITKSRSDTITWLIYSSAGGQDKYLQLAAGGTAAFATLSEIWGTTAFTSSTFRLGPYNPNASGRNFVAYLFATCPGVSKVGSYTGTATTLQVNCGFTAGARFVLIKRTDSTGDWYVWDSARGIVSGNDPYLLLNSTAAEVTSTDYIDTYSAGFEISSTAPAAINASAGSFIFLAIA
jgi:hypothetical protein